jgi:AraC-like DNA-binding protein
MYAYDCLGLAARMTGAPVPVLSFELRHARSGRESEYRRAFGALPRFERARNAWSVPADVLARPMLRADANLARFLEPQALALSRALPDRTTQGDVRAALAERLAGGGTSVSELAGALRVSPRTLQRRLADAGTSLRALADDVRRERALAQLAAGRSIAEVSFLLGFAEPRAFFRAFKRWTGRTPQEWRRDRCML